jgi:hypothetical protein
LEQPPVKFKDLESGEEASAFPLGDEGAASADSQDAASESANQPVQPVELSGLPEIANAVEGTAPGGKPTNPAPPVENETQVKMAALEEFKPSGDAAGADDNLTDVSATASMLARATAPGGVPAHLLAPGALVGLAKPDEKIVRGLAGEKRATRNAGPSTNEQFSATADFAEVPSEETAAETAGKNDGVKNFLPPSGKGVTLREHFLGINVANSAAEMSSASPTPLLETVFSRNAAPASMHVDGQGAGQLIHDFAPPQIPALNAAHQAVEAVMKVTERFTTESQRAVNLQFSVGGEDLSVRVAMHEGQVHTTFRTDSTELQSALAHEWRALTAENAERSHRYADPVYAGGESSFSDHGNTANRENKHGQETQQSERFESSLRNLPARAATSPVATLNAAHPMAPITTYRLHTFA